ncbi:MAG: copper resistance protein B, partial [Gammaproteobacteria bacterium]|nr:copper resistance protein B [Gammaproteobacteria bacterium]
MVEGNHFRRVLLVLAPILMVVPMLAIADEAPDDPGEHMDDDPRVTMFLLDRFEWQDASEGSALVWDLKAWTGTNRHRVLLRAAGERVDGITEENRVELLWWRPLASRWDVVAGLRHDLEPETPRSYAALGVQGLTPWWAHLEATAYLGEQGRIAATLEADTDWLLTNRLILSPRIEAEAYGRNDERNRIGNGLSEVTAGLRLRYEIRREFA